VEQGRLEHLEQVGLLVHLDLQVQVDRLEVQGAQGAQEHLDLQVQVDRLEVQERHLQQQESLCPIQTM